MRSKVDSGQQRLVSYALSGKTNGDRLHIEAVALVVFAVRVAASATVSAHLHVGAVPCREN